jgi:2',3'-cyclic-nucleotide 2'-phosphodiesterase (5'-nucleotidase family)
MATMVETLKEEFKGRALYLDAGDQFQGGIESSALVSSGQIMNDYFNEVAVDGSALGNHEFEFGPRVLFDFMENR